MTIRTARWNGRIFKRCVIVVTMLNRDGKRMGNETFDELDRMVGDCPRVVLTIHEDFAVVWHGKELYVSNDKHRTYEWLENYLKG